MVTLPAPEGLLFDYGGTLVEEISFDPRAGNIKLLSLAAYVPEDVGIDEVLSRANRISNEIAHRRNEYQLETPWPTLTRLIHEFLGIQFECPLNELEMAFWKASVETRPMPGIKEALEEFHQSGVPLGVVSNCAFSREVIRYELAKYGLADHLAFVMVSADYSVRKPNSLLFETAAAKLGVAPENIWFIGDQLDSDVEGARSAGMKAIWLSPLANAAVDGAVLRFASWQEIIEYFRRISLAGNPSQ